ncbi:MAG TPA: phosphoenolpyruvate carboxylase, partial [bacterium]|nr:phosphoenolpyruvate carboxylase [bacterium]
MSSSLTLSGTIHVLGDLLGQVLTELEGPALFEEEERIRALAKERRGGDPAAGAALAERVAALAPDAARGVAGAFALYFDLVNLAEEAHRVRALRQRARERHPAPIEESIGAAVAQLRSRGVTPQQMAGLLGRLSIEIVLTAHPTEAKRRTVLSKLRRITALLQALGEADALADERQDAQRALHAEIAALWLTDRARTTKPTVPDETRTALYFVDSVLWDALPRLYRELEEALALHYPGLPPPAGWLRLASWVGGDRDGNPYVTTRVTRNTLRLHRGLALERHRLALHEWARRLSVSALRVPPPPALSAWLEGQRPLPPHVAEVEARYPQEPYRLALTLLVAQLDQALAENVAGGQQERWPKRQSLHAAAVTSPLELLLQALPAPVTQDGLHTLRLQLQVFGLHAARLDLREDSGRLQYALGGLLQGLDVLQQEAFLALDAEARGALLMRLLEQPGPTPNLDGDDTGRLFRLLAQARRAYGPEGIGPFIISMTRSAADVLGVLLLARWAACDAGLSIAPLFETLEDLQAAPRVL